MPQCVFSFPLVPWQAKHGFQVEIFRLRVKLTFENDQKHPQPGLIDDKDNQSQLAIYFYPALSEMD